ncbi:MAG: FkbM family methyltransferase [Candidatus Thiothrix singaporensis]|uniref:FkbM family methyltransferase n=1 Tax=Candidatus Thiothrix singaporensis TaxID=2799669 RepID=A0A7L6ANJ0_9GAMM|nr:MAG: FkbM family methyltransferase [Candidatus Thiothrix singaporensis]
MSLKSYLQARFCPQPQQETAAGVNAGDVFQMVYGRLPDQSELDMLNGWSSSLSPQDHLGLFRTAINAFDHQKSGTAFTVRFAKDDMQYMVFPGFEVALDNKDVSVSVQLLGGGYEQHLFKFFNQTLKPGMVFMDIGANIGFYSMFAASKVGADGKVISFEPNTENCRLILLGMHRNKFQNIALYPFALGDRTGYALFSTHIGSNGGLIADTEAMLLNPNCTIVPIIPLDNLITEKVDVIKIDVEGAEGLVVSGAKGLLEKHRPIVASEFSLEMLSRVSGMSGRDYLQYFQDQRYDIYICDRQTQELIAIKSVEAFIDDYGEHTRIEDLAFIPR